MNPIAPVSFVSGPHDAAKATVVIAVCAGKAVLHSGKCKFRPSVFVMVKSPKFCLSFSPSTILSRNRLTRLRAAIAARRSRSFESFGEQKQKPKANCRQPCSPERQASWPGGRRLRPRPPSPAEPLPRLRPRPSRDDLPPPAMISNRRILPAEECGHHPLRRPHRRHLLPLDTTRPPVS